MTIMQRTIQIQSNHGNLPEQQKEMEDLFDKLSDQKANLTPTAGIVATFHTIGAQHIITVSFDSADLSAIKNHLSLHFRNIQVLPTRNIKQRYNADTQTTTVQDMGISW